MLDTQRIPWVTPGDLQLAFRDHRPWVGLIYRKSFNNGPGTSVTAYLLLCLMMASGLYFLISLIGTYRTECALIDRGIPVSAQVTAVHDTSKGNGRYKDYQYEVNGHTYKGTTAPDSGPNEPNYWDRGSVTVYYLPEHPEKSESDRETAKSKALGGVVFLLVWNAIIWTIGVFAFRGSLAKARIRTL
jgi:uncharacterized protein DUF3592